MKKPEDSRSHTLEVPQVVLEDSEGPHGHSYDPRHIRSTQAEVLILNYSIDYPDHV